MYRSKHWLGGALSLALMSGCASSGNHNESAADYRLTPERSETPERQVELDLDERVADTRPGLSWRHGESQGMGAAYRESPDPYRLRTGLKATAEMINGGPIYAPREPDMELLYERGAIRPDEQRLTEAVKALRKTPGIEAVLVTGHTSNVGTDTFNLELSRKRADFVAQAIREGLDQEIPVRSAGFGPTPLVKPNNVEGGRSANRRVEIHLQISEPERVPEGRKRAPGNRGTTLD